MRMYWSSERSFASCLSCSRVSYDMLYARKREGYRLAKSRMHTGSLYRPTVLHSTGCIRWGDSCSCTGS